MVYFIRHGETAWNKEKRYQGSKDSALTEYGRKQAVKIKKILEREISISASQFLLYVSPLQRAIETCNVIFSQSVANKIIDTRLREISLGSWDGITFNKIQEKFNKNVPFDWHFRSPDGDSFDESRDRIMGWLDEVKNSVIPVIVISHGLIGRILLGCYKEMNYKEMLEQKIAQDAVYKLDNNEVFVLGLAKDNDDWA